MQFDSAFLCAGIDVSSCSRALVSAGAPQPGASGISPGSPGLPCRPETGRRQTPGGAVAAAEAAPALPATLIRKKHHLTLD